MVDNSETDALVTRALARLQARDEQAEQEAAARWQAECAAMAEAERRRRIALAANPQKAAPSPPSPPVQRPVLRVER